MRDVGEETGREGAVAETDGAASGAFAFAVATRPIQASTASAAASVKTRAKMDVHGDARRRATRFDELMG